jgi:hypothetical protein
LLLGVLVVAAAGAAVFAVVRAGAAPAPPVPTITSGPCSPAPAGCSTTQPSATFAYSEAYGTNLSMGPQTTQGDLRATTGDWLAVGYHFSYTGKHAASTVTFDNGSFTFPVTCVNGATPTQSQVAVSAPSASYLVAANDNSQFPAGNTNAAAGSYEAAVQLPALCGAVANNIRLNQGGTFTALLSATNTTDKVQIQWHYIDAAAGKGGSGNVNCSNAVQNPDPGLSACTSVWGGNLNVVPGTAAASISYQCQLDGNGFNPCGTGASGTITYPGPLAATAHTFQVEAIVSSTASSPTSYAWTIVKASPTLALTQSSAPAAGPGTAGTAIPASAITAVLSGASGPAASGTITFKYFQQASAPTSCTSGGTTIGTASVAGNNSYHPNTGFTPSVAGKYWLYASYGGGPNDNPAASACAPGAPQEIVVAMASPTLGLTGPGSPGSGTLGTAISPSSITAVLGSSSGANAGGTITFKYFLQDSAPNPCTSVGTTIGTAGLSGNGSYNPNTGFTPTTAGTYWLYASYGGDPNNNGAASTCPPGAAQEIIVPKASPTLAVSAPSTATALTPIPSSSITATLGSSFGDTGIITFKVFGPQASPPASCTSGGTTVGTATPAGNGNYHPSASYDPMSAGTYWWYVSSPGDGNNNPAASLCNNASMTKTVVAAAPPLTLSGDADGTLYPAGPVRGIPVKFTNPNPTAVSVTSLTITPTGLAAGCLATDFTINVGNISAGNPLTVPANGSVTLPSGSVSEPTIVMNDTGVSQDNCKASGFTLSYTSGGTDTGSGSGSASIGTVTAFTVTVNSTTGNPLAPTVINDPNRTVDTVPVTVTNNDPGNERLTQLVFEITPGWHVSLAGHNDCTASDFSIDGQPVGNSHTVAVNQTIAGGGHYNTSFTIQMVENNHDQGACQSAHISLTVVAS